MGTTAHLVAVGADPELLDDLEARLRDLERRWTRLTDTSELARLNATAGQVTVLEPDTFRLVASAVEGWHRTGGNYDPTVAHAMRANGYAASFESITPPSSVATLPAPGCDDIVLMPGSSTVVLPSGVELDFGGIGKGFAADLLCEEALAQMRADGLCVNLGGDVRVMGTPPSDDGWTVELTPLPGPDGAPVQIALSAGAVCTSRVDKRAWAGPAGEHGELLHHVLDPRTGAPTRTDVTAISVIAGSATVAELVTKAAIVAGSTEAGRFVDDFGAAAMLLTTTGDTMTFGNFEDFIR